MPLTYHGCNPDAIRLVRLDRLVDSYFKKNQTHWTKKKQEAPLCPTTAKHEDKKCCDFPQLVYSETGHDLVCQNCGIASWQNFQEHGRTSIQIEARIAQDHTKQSPYCRLKHFKKVLRDVTRMYVRLPRETITTLREALGKTPPTRDTVRRVLRKLRLFHYYTSENYIAHMLGDRTPRITFTTEQYQLMCREAQRFGYGFDRLKIEKRTNRKNMINVHVLVRYLAQKHFEIDMTEHLRIPSKRVVAENMITIQQIEDVTKPPPLSRTR